MLEVIFHSLAVLMIVSAFFTATARNPVNAAMSMIVALVSLAGLLVLLETYFLAVLQVLVYAGAIVVLFLFIIMLIDAGKSPPPGWMAYLASAVALGLLMAGAYTLVFSGAAGPFPEITTQAPAALSRTFGESLFTRYLLPFQVVGFMLLIAMIGVIVITKKPKVEGGAS